MTTSDNESLKAMDDVNRAVRILGEQNCSALGNRIKIRFEEKDAEIAWLKETLHDEDCRLKDAEISRLRGALERTNYLLVVGSDLKDCLCTTNGNCPLHDQVKVNDALLTNDKGEGKDE